MTNRFLKQVAEFHEAMGYCQPEPTHRILVNHELNALRIRLFLEEFHELKDAIEAHDRIEILDALCDMQYIHSGTVIALGFRRFVEQCGEPLEAEKIKSLPAFIDSVGYAVDALGFHLDVKNPDLVLYSLREIQTKILQLVRHFKFTDVFPRAFTAVHLSNLSKRWRLEECQNNNIEGIRFAPSTDGLYVAWREDSKILKPPSFQKPQLAQFV